MIRVVRHDLPLPFFVRRVLEQRPLAVQRAIELQELPVERLPLLVLAVETSEIARERATFREWMEQHVLGVPDHAALLRKIGVAA